MKIAPSPRLRGRAISTLLPWLAKALDNVKREHNRDHVSTETTFPRLTVTIADPIYQLFNDPSRRATGSI